MFGLWKRLRDLERKVKQNSCDHIFDVVSVSGREENSKWLRSICMLCDKSINRCVKSKETDAACKLLRDELLK
ncbi:hypothetical protein LCGC14_0362030 [marine sediment metagenome]|uniref:Uncharacterized protein n=1 Tax=marine sediment metagenome TaxID=412755 RepID=A0A0F9T7N4_9ZZZZ